MPSTPIPAPTSVTYKDLKDGETEVTIEPCYPGYGMTLGNALRRVLLSSLPGSAVYAVKIKGVQHEYDVITNVKEDVVDILMNLKKLRLVSHADEPVTLEINGKGEKAITAGDAKKNAQIDVITKDLVIANLTDKKAELSMELLVKQGIGYEPVEERVPDKKDIGMIQIDSIFSPVLNVGFKVEHVRVGQRTDYEKIVMNIATDGTMSAKEAVTAAVQILQEQFAAVVAEPEETPQEPEVEADTADEKAES